MKELSLIQLGYCVLLLAAATSARGEETRAFSNVTTLSYPFTTGASEDNVSIRLRPSGPSYNLSLRQDLDVAGHVVVLEIWLQPTSVDKHFGNLLDPVPDAHGYQSYTFAASDFINGPTKSLFGRTRILHLKSIGATFQIDVLNSETTTKDAEVNRALPWRPQPYKTYFKRFKVSISYD